MGRTSEDRSKTAAALHGGEGSFPIETLTSEVTPRVGDGLIRLDVNGMVTFASPNAISAFRRLGLQGDLELKNLGLIAEELLSESSARLPRDESWQIILSGKNAESSTTSRKSNVGKSSGYTMVNAKLLPETISSLRKKTLKFLKKSSTTPKISENTPKST